MKDKRSAARGAMALAVSKRPQARIMLVVVLMILCDRIPFRASGQQQEQKLGFNGNDDSIDDPESNGGTANELSRQIDLPGKQLVIDEDDVDDDYDRKQRRSDWQQANEYSSRDFGPSRQSRAESTNHHFISVLNNQSNIITSPSSSLADLIQSNHTKSPISRPFDSDPHLKEELDLIAQNKIRPIVVDRGGGGGGVVVVDNNHAHNGSNEIYLTANHQIYQLKPRRQKIRKKPNPPSSSSFLSSSSMRDDLVQFNLLPTIPAPTIGERTAEQRLLEYLSSFNATGGGSSAKWPPVAQQASPAGGSELLVTSSSQPANEFEKTMLTKPPNGQPPIVSGSDASGDPSSVLRGSDLNLNDLDDDDDDDDDGRDMYLDPPKIEPPTPVTSNLDTNSSANSTTRFEEITTTSTSTTSTTTKPPLAGNQHEELLVGPFKSEADAPATITLSGIVYQKSGVRSTPLLATSSGGNRPLRASSSSLFHHPETTLAKTETENMSTSDSSTSSDSARKQQAKSQPSGLHTVALEGAAVSPNTAVGSKPFGSYHHLSGLQSNGPRFSDLHELAKLPSSSSSHQLMNHYYQQQQSRQPLAGAGESLTTAPTSSSYLSAGLLDDESQPHQPTGGAGWILAMDGLDSAASSSGKHRHHSKGAKHKPVVIVQKDVKPVKYHLMRAYLKLRRLLRPHEATYVFLS